MNIRDNILHTKLEKLTKILNLSAVNAQLALEYLSADEEDDSLLNRAEHQNFKDLSYSFASKAREHLDAIRTSDRERLPRYLKLYWAIGRSTAVFLWPRHATQAVYKEEQVQWKMTVLPKAAVAAMEAELMAWQQSYGMETDWLHELAKTEPAVLEEAQNLSGTPFDNMKTALSGILLRHAGDPGLIERQSAILLENNLDSLDNVAGWMSPDQKQAVRDYIQAGDPVAPVPLPWVLTAKDALNTRHSNDYLTGMLANASFQGQRVDDRARCALRVYLQMNPQIVLNSVTRLNSEEYFDSQFDKLLADLPGGTATMLLFLGFGRYWIDDDRKQKLMDRCAGGANEALKHANANQYLNITQALPYAVNLPGDERDRICDVMDKYVTGGAADMRSFLMGSGSLKDSRKELETVTGHSYLYPSQATGMMNLYRMDHGWDDFSCRCAVVLGVIFNGRGLSNVIANMDRRHAMNMASTSANIYYAQPVREEDCDNLAVMLTALMEKGLPMADALTFAGYLHDSTYNEAKQKNIRDCVYRVVAKAENIPDLCEAVKKGSVFARHTSISALDDLSADPAAKAGLLSAAGDSSKQIKELLVAVLTQHPDWAGDYKKLLTAKKAAERLMAVEVLGRLNERSALEAALESEKNAKVADAIRAKLGAEAPAAVGSPEDLASGIVKGNKVKKLSWLMEKPLPKLHKADGAEVIDDVRNAILLSYAELGRVGRSDTARELAAGIDMNDLADLACEVYEHWFAAGAQAKHKWVLSFAAVFGGAAMTPRLTRAINDWPNHARGAIACDAVMALALSTDPAALVIVDSISRKFKFRQVKQAAAVALENAAKELGITAEELADRIVPDLGFGKDGKRVFDYGKRSFTVRLTPTLELEITNDAGKAVKNLPAPGKTDEPQAAQAYEEFKTMKKQIKTTVTAQRARLEAALSVLRCWDTENWKDLFVGNPIMHQFAMSLVWGVYEDGKLTDTFRYMEDGSFNTVDEDEYELPEKAKIGLVHPVELDSETLDAWKQQLEDYEITQSVQQLDRPVYRLDEAKAGEKALEDFGGKQLNGLSLSGKLLGQGWYRGSVVDGGGYYNYYREDADLGFGVELSFSGSFVGDENDTVTVYDAVFYKAGTVQRGSYVYDEPKDENIFALGDIPARYYSEIVHHLTRATASSTETVSNWKEEKGN